MMFGYKFTFRGFRIGLFLCIVTYAYLSVEVFQKSFGIIGTANRYLKSNGGRNYFSRAGCQLPVLDAFEPEVTKREIFSTQEKCSGIPSIVYVDVGNVLCVNTSSLRFFNAKKPSDVLCTVESIKLEADHIVHFSKPVNMLLPVLLKSDFNRVNCKSRHGKPLFNNIVAGINNIVKERRHAPPLKDETADHISVLVFVIDSVSRPSAIRSLPETFAYLDHLQAYDYRGFTTIGLNTFPNLFGLLTGIHSTARTTKNRLHMNDMRMDDFHFLWNNYSEKGYVTMFNEECHGDHGIFYDGNRRGFSKQPTDHYGRPFCLSLFKNSRSGNQQGSKLCNENTMNYMEAINYVKQFMLHYKNKRKFGMSYISQLAHSDVNYLKIADKDIKQFFKWMNSSGFLQKTVVLFLGDHGPRLSKIRPTLTGRLESRLPMLRVLLPEHIKKSYPNLDANMKQNSDRLVTHFDIYQTLIDVLNTNYENPTVQFVNDKPRGISLFKEVSKSRTCIDADIPPEFCVCQQPESNTNVTNSSLVQSVAKQLVDYCNYFVSGNPKCQTLSLNRTIHMKFAYKLSQQDSDRHETYSGRKEYRAFYVLTIQTVPGYAIYEAFCETDASMKRFKFLRVSRINGDKDLQLCEKDKFLSTFCFCKNAIASSFDF